MSFMERGGETSLKMNTLFDHTLFYCSMYEGLVKDH